MRNETLDDLILSQGKGLRRTAEAAQIGRTSIWRWSRGITTPRHAQAAALAAVLGVDVDRVLAASRRSQLISASAGSPRESASASA